MRVTETERKVAYDLILAMTDEQRASQSTEWFTAAFEARTGRPRPRGAFSWLVRRSTENTPLENEGRAMRLKFDHVSKARKAEAIRAEHAAKQAQPPLILAIEPPPVSVVEAPVPSPKPNRAALIDLFARCIITAAEFERLARGQ